MDRLLVDFSIEGSGPLTRSLNEASTSGLIREDAPHWAIEPFIPLQSNTLVDYLVGRAELSPDQEQTFRQFCGGVDKILQERTASYQTRFSDAYAPLDPDTDSRVLAAADRDSSEQPPLHIDQPPLEPPEATAPNVTAPEATAPDVTAPDATVPDATSPNVAEVISLCEEILDQAGYRRLCQADIEQCVGVASHWGVPLHVDFDLFEQLVVFARGDIIGTKLRRRLRRLYRCESVGVPIYQRMVVMFRLRDDDTSAENLRAQSLHLRMFKNIPKQDIDMLLPGTRIRISGVDRFKIILPSLGGFLMSIRKIAQYALLFAAIALNWTVILVGLVLGYLVKSVLSYFQTKNRYQLNLTRNLYFQKLDTNAGVAYRMIQQSHRQSSVEMVIAYYAILSSGRPISTRRLRRRCERMIREAVDVEVDFQVERALQRLTEMQAVRQQDGQWKAA